MPTQREIDQMIAEEARVLRIAETAEKARLAAERAARDAMEQSKKRLAMLNRQKASAAYDETLALNGAAVADNQAAAAKLVSGLAQVEAALRELLPDVQGVERTFSEQQSLHDRIMGAAEPLLREAETDVQINDPDNQIAVDYARGGARRASYYQLEQRITPAMPMWAVLAEWVLDGKGNEARRIRQGIAQALYQGFGGVGPDTTKQDVQNEVKKRVSRLQRGY